MKDLPNDSNAQPWRCISAVVIKIPAVPLTSLDSCLTVVHVQNERNEDSPHE